MPQKTAGILDTFDRANGGLGSNLPRHRAHIRRALAIVALACSTTIYTQPALAQTGWTRTMTPVSPPMVFNDISSPRIAVEANGNAYAVWIEPHGGTWNTLLRMARYTRATDNWSAPVTLAGPAHFVGPDLAVDGLGNAFVAFTRDSFSGAATSTVEVIRSVLSSGSLEVTTLSSSATWVDPTQVVATATGDAIVVWTESEVLRSARYTAATGSWSASIGASADGVVAFQVEGDLAGNVTAIWWRRLGGSATYIAQAARLDSTSHSWSAALDLSRPVPTDGFGYGLALTVDPAGNATAAWAERRSGTDITIHAARFVASNGTWSSATAVSAPGGNSDSPDASMDSSGNVALVWRLTAGPTSVIQGALYSAATSSWGPPVTLSGPVGFSLPFPKVRFDALGNAIAVWNRWFPFGIQATRFTLATNTVSTTDLSAAGLFALHTDLAFDADGNATVVWFEAPSNVFSGTATIQSTRWLATPPPAPEPPSDLIVSSVAGNTATLAWTAAAAGPEATGYVVEGGRASGEVLATIPTDSTATTFTFVAPSGVFVVRVYAVRGIARSAASNEVRLVVNAPQPPSAPSALLGLVNGSTLALSWTNTFDGGAPTSVELHVTGALRRSVPLPLAEAFTFTDVPAGTYTFIVTASNASGVSPPSNAVTLTFPACTAVPGVPTHFSIVTRGRTLDLSWRPPVGGGAVTGYALLVSGAFVGSVPTTARSLTATVAPGTYRVSVVATNPCGTGPPTPPQTVTVPLEFQDVNVYLEKIELIP